MTPERNWPRPIPDPRTPGSPERTPDRESPRSAGPHRIVPPSTPKHVEIRTGSAPRTERITLVTAHCTIAAVDVEEFARLTRNNINQVRIRHGLYRAMRVAFDRSEIPWDSCHREDRGDGILVLAPAEVSKALFVDRLPEALADALTAHNRIHPVEERMRLKLALHAGEINYDGHGVTGSSITHTFRLLDAQALAQALTGSSAVLAMVGSGWFFDEVIRHSESSKARSYRPVDVRNKETSTKAWVRLLRGRATKPAAVRLAAS